MILTIDIGNTNIVVGCFEEKGPEKRLLFFERFSTEQEATPLEYATIFKETLELHEIRPLTDRGRDPLLRGAPPSPAP